jgi:hypothetical protein
MILSGYISAWIGQSHQHVIPCDRFCLRRQEIGFRKVQYLADLPSWGSHHEASVYATFMSQLYE